MSNDNYEELDVHSFIEPKYKTKRFKITMTNETKQTSVEQFAIALYEGGYLRVYESGDEIETLLNQFKEMEKEQMCKFAYKCHNHYKVYGDFLIEQYYNETYGGNK